MLKRLDYRILLGFLLIVGGGLLLAERLGYLTRASDLFWGLVFLLGGGIFVSMFIGGQWWAIIPGLTLVGVAGSILLPSPWDEMAVLAGIALAFWMVYVTKRDFWWAIIPAGVLTTLVVLAWLPGENDNREAFVLFLGIAITFLVVALATGMRWAFWPALALAILSLLFAVPSFLPYLRLTDYIWPVLLILGGLYLVLTYFRKQ